MADDSDPTSEGLDALAGFFVDEGTLGETLGRLSELACDVGPADMAGITMLVEGRPNTGVFTDAEAPEIDEAQYSSGQGPCLDAFRHQRIFRIGDTATEDRWPDFARVAAAHGVVSTLSVPVSARGQGLGALNLYSRVHQAYDEASAASVQTFARQAAVVLVNAQTYGDARALNENLQTAMRSRSTIDYAIGILMANGAPGSEEAFQILVRASQRENRKLRDIAQEIVERAATARGPESPGPVG